MILNNFINNEFVAPVKRNYLDNFCPGTGEVYSQLADSDEQDIENAVISAKNAFLTWSKTTVSERVSYLEKIADLIEERADEFAAAESKDQGKPLWLAKKVDIPRASYNFRFFAAKILTHENKSTKMDQGALNYSLNQPIGVTGLISPWNLPLYLLTWKVAPALAMGNTAVCKPSELTPLTAFLFAKVIKDAGLPKGVCNIVLGLGKSAGKALTSHPDVPLISFTGGTQTAEDIIISSAPHFKKLGLELGGKNPNIIFDDCDFEKALETSVRSAFTNQGEICLCGSRIFVQRKIYNKFLERFVEETKKLKVGDPSNNDSFMGALVSKNHLEKVKYFLEMAQEDGGEILCGGVSPIFDQASKHLSKGYFLEPAVVAGLDQSCRLLQEEVFGPVVTITPFDTEQEVVEWANSTKYGLSATVWSQDISKAHRVAENIQAGQVWVNTWMLRDLRVPFGGMKASGLGREGGDHSLDFYSEQKNICVKL